MAALTNAIVLEGRQEVGDTSPQPIVSYPALVRMWARAGESYEVWIAMWVRRMAIYYATCGNKDAAIEYRQWADSLEESSGLGLGTLTVGHVNLNQNYPLDDDDSVDRLDWEG